MLGQVIRCLLTAMLLLSGAALSTNAQAQVVAGEEHCVVNIQANDSLNFRRGPGAYFPSEGAKPYGSCGILVTGACLGNWCPAEDGHMLGWVNKRYISMVSPALYCVAGVAPGDRLNLRAYPASTSRVLTRLARNQCDIAFLPYRVGGWQKIRVGGWQGWASLNYLSGQ